MTDLGFTPGGIRITNGKAAGVHVGVLSNELARFSAFFQSLLGVMGNLPPGSGLGWAKGVNIPKACNRLVAQMLEGTYEWLWIMGDDHTFDNDIVVRLIEHDVDVVVPHCLGRYPPWDPVVWNQDEDGLYFRPNLPKSGLTEIHAAGSAGMLIRRRVLEAVEAPWFEGRNEDIGFCEKAREAGFSIYIDPEIRLGHVTLATVRPAWADGQWHPEMVHDGGVAFTYPRPSLVPA